MSFAFSSRALRFSALFASAALCSVAACSSAPVATGTSGEGGGEGTSSSGGETSSNGGPTLGTPVGSSSGETSSNGGTSSGTSSGTSGSSSGTSGASSSGTSGTSTGPRPECVAWANRHCTCLEKAGAAAADCRTKTAKGCEDAVSLCPKQLSWYTCSQTTCGNTCPNPGC